MHVYATVPGPEDAQNVYLACYAAKAGEAIVQPVLPAPPVQHFL